MGDAFFFILEITLQVPLLLLEKASLDSGDMRVSSSDMRKTVRSSNALICQIALTFFSFRVNRTVYCA